MKLISAVMMAATLSACAKAPPPKLGLSDPSNSTVPVKPVSYSSVGSGYESNRPVGPKDWMKTNQSVAPGAN